MTKIILIRGNSGSGKTTVANELHDILGEGSLLISQDYVRRTMLKVRDKPYNLAIGLIETMIKYGIDNCNYVIVEGILASNKYGDMLRETLSNLDDVYAYYYDLSIEETIRRHYTKDNVDFGPKQLKDWFTPHDLIGFKNEKNIDKNISKKEMVKLILSDIDY